MTITAVALFIEKFGPLALQALPVLQKLYADIAAGRGQQVVTDADWIELNRLASQSGEDIYRRLGIVPPPPAAPTIASIANP